MESLKWYHSNFHYAVMKLVDLSNSRNQHTVCNEYSSSVKVNVIKTIV